MAKKGHKPYLRLLLQDLMITRLTFLPVVCGPCQTELLNNRLERMEERTAKQGDNRQQPHEKSNLERTERMASEMSRANSYCCDCVASHSRCSADSCPCVAARKTCDEHCESTRYRGDCLNQAICKCSCEVDPAKPAKNACSKNERCDCLRIKEGCSKLCACKQICKNKEPPKKLTKVAKPSQGCQCAKSKKQCVDLYEILIFVSKSPCFHQDCDPKCEVVDECKSNKACAKLLGLLLSKVRKEIKKVDVKMTVKFLYPHLNRGDLYTKQGILSMLQAGIKVEPLLMKDWCSIMDWSPNIDHKGDYLQSWTNHHLDKAVAQSQLFIKECRRALGLSMKFWVAEIHEIVKDTILHFSDLRVKCGDLNDALKQNKNHFSEDAQAQAMVASFCGRSFDDCETDEIAQRIRRATANINLEIETLLEFLTHKGAIS
ncbi:hypothetical protein WR25_23237 [Diploscapter pachys]|uniref:Activation-induced cytidine deaminase AID domain-containing protein n=1 Tax=Diploscapter pachys TaxID=2018661 RepID=A0A2A2JVV0_9BILA|nr:hypothetical protein WR25_23237 [Diploscapter pachys]